MRLVLLGKQGAGKGTQAAHLARHYVVPHISTGEEFRRAVREGTDVGAELARYMDAGELVPDDLVIRLVAERLSRPDAARGFIFDGFPRTRPQAEELKDVLAELGGLDAVVNVKVPHEVVRERLVGRRVCSNCGANYHVLTPPRHDWTCDECGGQVVQRTDDTPQAIDRRLALYDEQTAPLIDFYRDLGVLVEVDGVGALREVFDRIVDAVDAQRERARVSGLRER